MFTYAKGVGCKECKWTIHWGHQQPVPREESEAKTQAVQMVGFWTTWEEVEGIYNEVFQQKRLLGTPLYGLEQMEALDWEIFASLEEQMWKRLGTDRLEEDLRGATASILLPSCQAESCSWTQVRNKDPHDQVLKEAREAHLWVLEAAHLLEQDIERLSQTASRVKHAKCWHPYSHSHSLGRPQGRCVQSLSPHRPKKCVTFLDKEKEMSSGEDPLRQPQGQATRGGEVEESNLCPTPTIGLELECFLETPTTTQGARDQWGPLPEPSIDNSEMWLEWQACQVDTPNWWKELVTIPNVGDPKRLAQKICASFKVPRVRCKTLRDHGEYTTPPALKCIQRNMFLSDTSSHLLYQDYQLKPPQKTIAYAQALQYWAEKANPPVPDEPPCLAMSIHELRWHMRRYMTFSDHDVFEGLVHGLPEVEVEETTQPNPTEPLPADDPAVLTIAPSGSENVSATLITTPATSKEESITLVTISAALADELANPPILSEITGNARSLTEPEYPKWIKVHLSHMAASVGSIPCNPGDLRWPAGGKELGTSWRKNSRPSDFLPAQPCLEAPQSQHPKRRKTQEPNQRCCLWNSKR